MFSNKFSNITNKFPLTASAASGVENYLNNAAEQKRLDKLRLDPRLIKKISKVESNTELALLISLLLSEHILRRVVVVMSPAGGGVAEYSSIDEVPDRVHDHLRDMWMQVTLDDIQTFYVAEL